MSTHNNYHKVTTAGLLIALGIVFGDIGTSPLYTMNAIVRGKEVSEMSIIGVVSCVIWTLTLQTTVKYVIFTLKADNNGEGGVFSLYALVRRKSKWLVFFAMVGGAMLLADGLITPPITVSSAMEGLSQPEDTTIKLTLLVITGIFFMQQFGTKSIGKLFGPIMAIWFSTMFLTGISHLMDDISILKAFNPYYAIQLLVAYPGGFWLLGAVFLCTTGAEALYSDLGHCGKNNIRVSWIFVKSCLIVNYIGQGSYALGHYKGMNMPDNVNLFFVLFPPQLKFVGVALATIAAIIASQALISGAYTLISEAMKLNLWPKQRIKYPTDLKGQLFIPGLNILMWAGCILIVLYFRKSAAMEGAYGLAISITMVITTILFATYLYHRKYNIIFIGLLVTIFSTIEISFLVANMEKFEHGGFVTILIGTLIFMVMFIWFRARKIKNRFVEFVDLKDYSKMVVSLSNDETIPKFATHLVYLSSADLKKQIEYKIVYSIINNRPKRADVYWILHVDVGDIPFRREYEITVMVPNKIIRIDFRLGFRENPRVQSMFKQVLQDLERSGELDVLSRFDSLRKNNIQGDYRFLVMEKFLSFDHSLSLYDKLVMQGYFFLKRFSLSEDKAFGLNINNVTIEKVPLVVFPLSETRLKRIYKNN